VTRIAVKAQKSPENLDFGGNLCHQKTVPMG
jgi:hypothetical protein